jgi:hypothetical protein
MSFDRSESLRWAGKFGGNGVLGSGWSGTLFLNGWPTLTHDCCDGPRARADADPA